MFRDRTKKKKPPRHPAPSREAAPREQTDTTAPAGPARPRPAAPASARHLYAYLRRADAERD
jgi:hypothetical protein